MKANSEALASSWMLEDCPDAASGPAHPFAPLIGQSYG